MYNLFEIRGNVVRLFFMASFRLIQLVTITDKKRRFDRS